MTPSAAGGSGTSARSTVLFPDPVTATLVCLAVGLLVVPAGRRRRGSGDD